MCGEVGKSSAVEVCGGNLHGLPRLAGLSQSFSFCLRVWGAGVRWLGGGAVWAYIMQGRHVCVGVGVGVCVCVSVCVCVCVCVRVCVSVCVFLCMSCFYQSRFTLHNHGCILLSHACNTQGIDEGNKPSRLFSISASTLTVCIPLVLFQAVAASISGD